MQGGCGLMQIEDSCDMCSVQEYSENTQASHFVRYNKKVQVSAIGLMDVFNPVWIFLKFLHWEEESLISKINIFFDNRRCLLTQNVYSRVKVVLTRWEDRKIRKAETEINEKLNKALGSWMEYKKHI